MRFLDSADTIAAVASPLGYGFRGIVRLSGPQAIAIASVGFAADRPWKREVTRGSRREGRLAIEGLRNALPASLLLWPGRRTYTGEPLAEIHTVASAPILQFVLSSVLSKGARPAERGEFTLRAFLSGRIDLTRAEAVLGVIEAESALQLDTALKQLAGGLAGPIAVLRDQLLDILAHLEANLDFVDEPDVDPLGRTELGIRLARGSDQLALLAEQFDGRDRPEGLPRVVLVGPPNAGKSRLFNALLGRSQALVSPIPGTTRDYLAAPCDCNGMTIELIDTAGADNAATSIEAAAQSVRADQSDRAELLLDCLPINRISSPLMGEVITSTIRVITKSDLIELTHPNYHAILTSAATGEGVPQLKEAIASKLGARPAGAHIPSTGARCRDSLKRASALLASASAALRSGLGDELVSVDIREAIDELGNVIGVVVGDDVLDRIFRRFCIGK